jgi:hypothetical protein
MSGARTSIVAAAAAAVTRDAFYFDKSWQLNDIEEAR